MNLISAREAAEKPNKTQNTIPFLSRADDRLEISTAAGKPIRVAEHRKGGRSKAVPHPFFKWAGGKGQLLPEIRKRCFPVLNAEITKYAEPFVGGGAVLFDLIGFHPFEKIYISDVNRELINTYCVIRDRANDLIAELHCIQDAFLPLDQEHRKTCYYQYREEYNQIKWDGRSTANLRKAVLMIFLNRTCYNGLYRVNRKGIYNVPIGAYQNPRICDEENFFAVSKALQGVDIVCAPFRDSEPFIDRRTLVYFDPPYRPLNATSHFNSYSELVFDDEQQKKLAVYFDHLSEKGAKLIESNSDPKNTDPDDDFFDRLYAKHKIKRVAASRMINSRGKSRGRISELLITNF